MGVYREMRIIEIIRADIFGYSEWTLVFDGLLRDAVAVDQWASVGGNRL